MRETMKWSMMVAGLTVGALAGVADAQQTYPENGLLFFVDAPQATARQGLVSVSTAAGTFTTVRISPRGDGRIVVPRRAWGKTVGRVRAGSAAAALRLPARPRGTIVLNARAPRVELVPMRGSYDLRLSRIAAGAREIELTFTSPAGPLVRRAPECRSEVAFRVVAVRTVGSPAVATSTSDC